MNGHLLLSHVGITLAIIVVYVTLWFLVALYKKRNDVADIAWGLGIAFVGFTSLMLTNASNTRLLLMALLVTLWGARLSYHIYRRVRSHTEEDYRYAQWRKEWRHFTLRSYLQVFLLQGFLMIVVGYSLTHVGATPSTPLGVLDLCALVVWVFGFFFEVVGDRQLKDFIASKPALGAVLDSGLWRYSRHPNYFGEVVQWWGIWLFALSVPYSWLALISPLTITFLILKVSGIPLLEVKLMQNPRYQEYAKRTSVFVPLPPTKLPSPVSK